MVEVCFHMLYVLSLHLCAGGPATLERDLCPGSDGGMGGDKRDTAARPPLGGDNWVWNSRGSVDSLQTARTPCLPGLLCFVVLLSFFFSLFTDLEWNHGRSKRGVTTKSTNRMLHFFPLQMHPPRPKAMASGAVSFRKDRSHEEMCVVALCGAGWSLLPRCLSAVCVWGGEGRHLTSLSMIGARSLSKVHPTGS